MALHEFAQSTDFYPRPPRGGRLRLLLTSIGYRAISIHALREEGDVITFINLDPVMQFLSTPSARRATSRGFFRFFGKTNFYPRPPRGGRPGALACPVVLWLISIHALREEGDVHWRYDVDGLLKFLSTPSARRATSGSSPLSRTD